MDTWRLFADWERNSPKIDLNQVKSHFSFSQPKRQETVQKRSWMIPDSMKSGPILRLPCTISPAIRYIRSWWEPELLLLEVPEWACISRGRQPTRPIPNQGPIRPGHWPGWWRNCLSFPIPFPILVCWLWSMQKWAAWLLVLVQAKPAWAWPCGLLTKRIWIVWWRWWSP